MQRHIVRGGRVCVFSLSEEPKPCISRLPLKIRIFQHRRATSDEGSCSVTMSLDPRSWGIQSSSDIL